MFFKIQNLIKIMTELTTNAGQKVVSKNFLACEQCKLILIGNANKPNSEVKVEEFDMKISQKGKGTNNYQILREGGG